MNALAPQQTLEQLCVLLRLRLAGRELSAGLLDWLRPETIDGLALGGTWSHPCLQLDVNAAWPLHTVPPWLDTPVGRLRLRPQRRPRAHLQVATVLSPSSGALAARGSVGFLANDNYAPEANFAVTAGHVLGALEQANFNTLFTIDAAGVQVHIERACLAECATPLAVASAGPYAVDAGLLRLRPDDWQKLIAGVPRLIPVDVGAAPTAGQALQVLQADGGTVSGVVAGVERLMAVNVERLFADGSSQKIEIRVDGLQSSRLDSATEAGDSGAPVHNARGEIVGIHCAYRDADSGNANALFTPIGRILSHFDISALTQKSRNLPMPTKARPALQAARPRPTLNAAPATPPVSPPARQESVDTLARTLWAEARGEGELGMVAVAWVVLNRARRGGWWGNNIVAVCRFPSQFSCWNEGTASRRALLQVTELDQSFAQALRIAQAAVDGRLCEFSKSGQLGGAAGAGGDFTQGALHYHTVDVSPKWARGLTPCFALKRHIFYNNVL